MSDRDWVLVAGVLLLAVGPAAAMTGATMPEQQLTFAPHGHMLTNAAVWSADSRWIVYDTRESLDGSVFDGTRIERVDVATGRIEVLYESTRGACCGVVTASPVDNRVVFIHGPEDPTADWQYAAWHRRGVVVRSARPGVAENLDARDLMPPFTPGALRGGSHVHMFSPDGKLVSFTYEDAVLANCLWKKPSMAFFHECEPQKSQGFSGFADAASSGGSLYPQAAKSDSVDTAKPRERNRRGIGVTICGEPVAVPSSHNRNHAGSGFTVLVTRLHDQPTPGSDQIGRACEEAWVGTAGYTRADGKRQRHALACQGEVVTVSGQAINEVFLVDLPELLGSMHHPGAGPLAGTATSRPAPPLGVSQRRLTDTTGWRFPGIAGPRHWLRSSPDGSQIAFLARDDNGVVQIFTVSPTARPAEDGNATLRQITRDRFPVASAFSWSPCGHWIAYVADGSVFRVAVDTGKSVRLTARRPEESGPRPEACVHSPDGRWVAFMRVVHGVDSATGHSRPLNQIFVVPTVGAD